jgi:hypothetical protein
MYIFLELCSQAKIYAFIALLLLCYIVIKNPENSRYDIALLFLKASAFIAWTFAINKLCSTGYKYIAWIAAIVPHLIYILLLMNLS